MDFRVRNGVYATDMKRITAKRWRKLKKWAAVCRSRMGTSRWNQDARRVEKLYRAWENLRRLLAMRSYARHGAPVYLRLSRIQGKRRTTDPRNLIDGVAEAAAIDRRDAWARANPGNPPRSWTEFVTTGDQHGL